MISAHRTYEPHTPRSRTLLAGLLVLLLTLITGLPASAAPAAGNPILRTITIGLEPFGLVEDSTVGHALVFNTWDPSAMIVDVRRGTVLRTLALGSKEDFVSSDVDPRAHRFVLSLPRGLYSKGGGNVVYLLDSRSGKVLKTLQGLQTPGGVAIDPAGSHVFVADAHRSAVLEYDSRNGALLRAVPSCHGTEEMALSSATGHLFVRCSDGTILMHDLATGNIITKLTSQATGTHNNFVGNFGTDTELVLQEQTHRLIVADLATGVARLYDSATGTLIRILPSPSGSYSVDTVHRTFITAAFTPDDCTNPTAGAFTVLSGTTGARLGMYSVPLVNLGIQLANPVTGHLLAIAGRINRSAGCSPLGPATLDVIDARDGKLLRSITVGHTPPEMVVDRQAGLLLLETRGWATTPERGTLAVLNLAQL